MILIALGCVEKPESKPAPPVAAPMVQAPPPPPEPPQPQGPTIEERLRVPTNLRELQDRPPGFALATWEKYEAIPQGWSYRKVEKIMGSLGIEQSEKMIGGTTYRHIRWDGVKPGSYCIVVLADGVVISKEQVGLR